MKVNVEVDLGDFMDDEFLSRSLSELVMEQVKDEVMKLVKRDPKYKAFINKQATEMLGKIEL